MDRNFFSVSCTPLSVFSLFRLWRMKKSGGRVVYIRRTITRSRASMSNIRLINASTLRLQQFTGSQIPPYAILSHTWEEDEVSFQDIQDLKVASQKKGFVKIWNTCKQALKGGIDHVWVDTCCIDKASSSELTEAINSMFQWYAASSVCYTYLEDISPGSHKDMIVNCRWFRRGWTLQELIAPKEIHFYDNAWTLIGTKMDLSHTISRVTGVGLSVLRDRSLSYRLPVAERMSWAANRETTRVEDIAYSLLGIFDVNMPLLYGEGERAFIRLQEEIIKSTNDMSLFAWKQQDTSQEYRGILAKSPAEFAEASSIVPNSDYRFNEEFSMTNRGMRIKGEPTRASRGDYFLGLNCSYGYEPDLQIGIYLKHYGAGFLYARHKPYFLPVDREPLTPATRTIYITKHLNSASLASIREAHHHAIRLRHGFSDVFIANALPKGSWDARNSLFLTGGHTNFAGILHLQSERWKGSLAIGCALVASGALPLAKFIDLKEVNASFESRVLSDPQNFLRLPKTVLLDQQVGLKLSIKLEERQSAFCIDLVEAESFAPSGLDIAHHLS